MIDETEVGAAPAHGGSLIGNVNVVMLTYAADGVLALATGALVARALGPDGRGAYGLFIVSAAFGQLVLGLGIGNAAIYYINKSQLAVREALSAIHILSIAAIAVSATAAAVIVLIDADDAFGGGLSPWLLVAAIPVLLYMNLLRLLLQALNRFVDLGVATVGQQTVLLALVAIAFTAGDPTATQIVVYLLIASACAALYSVVRIGLREVDVAAIARPRVETMRRLVGFGIQGEAGNALQALNYRLDQFILRGFESLTAVGVYAVATSMSEGVFVLANAVALVLMPRLTSADPDDAARMTPVAARNTIAIAAAGSLALAASAPLLLPAIFGERFDDSVAPLWWLLPGAVALTGSKVLTSYVFSQGRPLVNTAITAVSLAATLVADVAFIPAFGVEGAAAAASIGYGVHLIAALFAYRAISGQPAIDAIVPRIADIELYADAIRGMRDRISGRAAARAGS